MKKTKQDQLIMVSYQHPNYRSCSMQESNFQYPKILQKS